MHIFLTGEIQVGKSTLIKKVLRELPSLRPGGFCTVSRPDIPGTGGSVYLVRAGEKDPVFGTANRVGIRCRLFALPEAEQLRMKAFFPSEEAFLEALQDTGPIAFPKTFDEYGVLTLADAEKSRLILMDEIGKMECRASLFSKRVLTLLNGDVPVFGVLRKEGQTLLQEQIRNHPKVTLIEVTEENRDDLVPQLTRLLLDRLVIRKDSGGAIVHRGGKDSPEILMIRGRKGWGFPKGQLEEGETLQQTAIREVKEETGITILIEENFSYTTPSGKPDEKRNITYFLGKALSNEISPQYSEVKNAEWVRAEDVEERLQFVEDIPVWEAAWEIIKTRLEQKEPKGEGSRK